MSYVLRTNKLSKHYKDKKIIEGVNITVKKGEIYGLLGVNGAGKTTIMKLITNLIKPTFGSIEVFGQTLTNQSYDVLKRMGSIIEKPIFYDHLTGIENLEIHCDYMGYHDKKAIREVLSLVKLEDIEKKAVKHYSLGMQQRLAIARAIVTRAELLILDEPINGLDPLGIKDLRDLFKMLCKEYGTTIIISSHILAEMEQIADTIGVISQGSLIKEVSIENLRESCHQYIELEVEEVSRAACFFDEIMQLKNFKLKGETTFRIYDEIEFKDVSRQLHENGFNLLSITKKQSSLEDYFIDLINGGVSHDQFN